MYLSPSLDTRICLRKNLQEFSFFIIFTTENINHFTSILGFTVEKTYNFIFLNSPKVNEEEFFKMNTMKPREHDENR